MMDRAELLRLLYDFGVRDEREAWKAVLLVERESGDERPDQTAV